MEYESDATGSWLANLSEPTTAIGAVIDAQTELLAHQAHRMGVNTTDMRALRLLDLHGPLGATDLAHHLDLRPASVTTLVDRLEAAGHLERVRDSPDRRRVMVRARPETLRRSFDTWAPAVRAMDDIGHGLSPDEQRVVCDYLDRVAAAMRAHAGSS